MKKIITSFSFLLVFTSAYALRTDSALTYQPKFSVLFGLNQPIVLGGFNAELNYWTKRFVVDYSHGIQLKMPGELIGGEVERQQLDVKIPHTLGFGFGYRITNGLNLRLEPKLHIFELYNKDDAQLTANRIARYFTFTLGLGAYYRWMPFQKKANALKGITIAPSVRWWPNISSSLTDDKLNYTSKTGQQLTHNALNIGVQNTPWIINISVGYSFSKQ
ncbi:MAG: hypothetical protein ACK5Z2_18825 [Bacteroidota bacterium]|jgi:hypothetical protein